MEILVLIFGVAILILSLVIFYVVWRLISERRKGIPSFGWLSSTPNRETAKSRSDAAEDEPAVKRESNYHFVERAEADPRAFLDKILANEAVKDEFYAHSMAITDITNVKDYTGQFRAVLKCEFGSKPIHIHILVFPSAFHALFCLQAWEDDNTWLSKKIEIEDELDPEIPEGAVKTFSSFFKRLSIAISESGLFLWPSDKR